MALLLLGIAAGPASAAIDINITSANITRGAASTTLPAFNVTFDAGDANTASGVRLILTGTGITFNTSTSALDDIAATSSNISRLPHGGAITATSNKDLTISLSASVSDTANWTITGVQLILTNEAVANTTFTVRGATAFIKDTFDIVPLVPNVARATGIANLSAGNSSQLMGANLVINSTSSDPIDLYQWINLTIDTTGVTFDRSMNSSIVNQSGDAVGISTVSTSNYSSDNKTVSLWINRSAGAIGNGINITGLYVNVAGSVLNGTIVNIIVKTTPDGGYEINATNTAYNFTVWTPRISYSSGATNNNVTAGNNSQLLDSYLIINSTVANDLKLGTKINLTINTAGIAFNRSMNSSIVNDAAGDVVDISTVSTSNYSSDNKTVSLWINSSTNAVGDGMNLSGLYVDVASTVANGTVVNISVSTIQVNGSEASIVSTLYNFTVWKPSISARTADVIYVDNLGIVNATNVSVANVTINAIGINSTVDNDVGDNTLISLNLESGGVFKFLTSWTGITSTNSGTLNVNLSGTLRALTDYAMSIPVNGSSTVGNWVSISGINLSIQNPSTISAGTYYKYITVTTKPLNGTGYVTLNTTDVNLTVIKLAPDVVTNITANTSAVISSSVTLVFNATNSTYGKTFGGTGVTFSVDNSNFVLGSTTGTTNTSGQVAVVVTLPSTAASANVTAKLTSNDSINDTIQVTSTAGPATQLLVTHDGPKLKSNTLWENNITVTVYALDAGGNKNTSVTNSVTLTTNGTAVVNNTAAVAMVAGVVSWNVSSTSAESILLTATSAGLTTGTNTTSFTEPITGITVTATPSSITANGSNTTVRAQLTGASGNVPVAGVTVTFTSLNATLADFNNFTGSVTATTLAGGYVEVNLTSNPNNVTGTVQVQATAAGKGGTTTVTITVVPVLTTITVSPATASVVVGNTATFTAATLDQNGAAITATVTWNSSNITVGTINSTTGVFTALAAGTSTINATSGSVTGTATVTVTAQVLNQPPVISSLSPLSVTQYETVQLIVTASDPEGQVLYYAWDFDNDGVFEIGRSTTNTLYHTFSTNGTNTIRVHVDDGVESTEESFNIIVASATIPSGNDNDPVISSISPVVVTTGSLSTLTLTATDADGDTLYYAWDIDGNGAFESGRSTGNTISTTIGSTRVINVRVDDGIRVTTMPVTIAASSTGANALPTFTAATPTTATVNVPTTFTLSATDSDSFPNPISYMVDADNSGTYDPVFVGSTSTTRSTINQVSITFTTTGSHVVPVRVDDGVGITTSYFTVVVS